MPKVPPTHNVRITDVIVYHNNNKCTERNSIVPVNVRNGTDGRPLCKRCDSLNEEGK
jgi:hypothetical protein